MRTRACEKRESGKQSLKSDLLKQLAGSLWVTSFDNKSVEIYFEISMFAFYLK